MPISGSRPSYDRERGIETKTVSVRIDLHEYEAYKAIAKQRDKTMSALIMEALREQYDWGRAR